MSALLHISNRAIHFIETFTEAFGKIISWLNLFLMLSVFAVVMLRYVLNMGSIALQELAVYIHSIIFLSACAYTLRHNGHVRVDIFYRRFTVRTRGIVDSLGTVFFLLPVCLFIGFISWDYIDRAWAIKETSHDPGGLPAVYLLKSLILVLVSTLTLQGIAELLKGIIAITSPQVSHSIHETTKEAA